MNYFTTIRLGIETVNKNWHLVLIQMAAMLISVTVFFFTVGVPVGIAFVIFGLDFTELLRLKNIESLYIGSAELLDKYFVMALVMFLSITIYVLSVSVVWLFTIGGVAGVFKESILEGKHFSLKSFFKEGKENFFPITGFSIIIGTLILAVAFVFGVFGGLSSRVIESAKTQEETLALFLSIFFILLLLSVGFTVITLTLAITLYGIAQVVTFRQKGLEAFFDTLRFLWRVPSTLAFCVFVLVLYLLAGFVIILISSPFTFIPIIGTILALPFQILNYSLQSYMSLVMIASVFHFFYGHQSLPFRSNEEIDTSAQAVSTPDPAPQDTESSAEVEHQRPPQSPSQ